MSRPIPVRPSAKPGACSLVLCRQRIDEFVEIAGHDAIDLVERQVDAVIGDAALREIVGADALAAIAGADLGFAVGSARGVQAGALAFRRCGERRIFIAFALFLCWLRSSCMATTVPVGIWVMRTAESVLLTC